MFEYEYFTLTFFEKGDFSQLISGNSYIEAKTSMSPMNLKHDLQLNMP